MVRFSGVGRKAKIELNFIIYDYNKNLILTGGNEVGCITGEVAGRSRFAVIACEKRGIG